MTVTDLPLRDAERMRGGYYHNSSPHSQISGRNNCRGNGCRLLSPSR